jgi:hypothetical protein
MATTPNFGVALPDQTTSPDVVTWYNAALGVFDAILGSASAPIKVQAGTAATQPLRRDQILYGPLANVPATLPVGTVYLGHL